MFKYKPKYHLSKNPRPIFHSWFSIEGFRVFEDHPCVPLVLGEDSMDGIFDAYRAGVFLQSFDLVES